MEIKKRLNVKMWKIIGKIVGIVVDVIFYLAQKYPNSVFRKFIL